MEIYDGLFKIQDKEVVEQAIKRCDKDYKVSKDAHYYVMLSPSKTYGNIHAKFYILFGPDRLRKICGTTFKVVENIDILTRLRYNASGDKLNPIVSGTLKVPENELNVGSVTGVRNESRRHSPSLIRHNSFHSPAAPESLLHPTTGPISAARSAARRDRKRAKAIANQILSAHVAKINAKGSSSSSAAPPPPKPPIATSVSRSPLHPYIGNTLSTTAALASASSKRPLSLTRKANQGSVLSKLATRRGGRRRKTHRVRRRHRH